MKDNTEWIKDAAAHSGVSWLNLFNESETLILFGSQAMDCGQPDSDIDLLAISPNKEKKISRRITGKFDIITLSSLEVNSEWWLGSELAFHIWKYGKILKGSAPWTGFTFISESNLKKKSERIGNRLMALLENNDDLTKEQQVKHTKKIRRDCQRLRRMIDGVPGVCTKILDDEWEEHPDKQGFIKEMLNFSNLPSRTIEDFLCYPI